MNLNQLSVFREVMKTGSISQAARNLGRTQPAVSLALKGFEESLGFQLFLREGRALLPVPEAQYLLSESAEILDRVEEVSRTLENLKQRQSGRLNIAAMPGPSALLFPQFVSNRIKGRPDVRLSFVTRPSTQILQLVASQSLDFGFADWTEGEAGNLPYKADVLSTRCLCAIPARHDLARQSVVRVQDLSGEPMGVLSGDHFSRMRVASAFERAGVQMDVRIECQHFLPIFHFVEAGQCVSIVDPLSVETYLRQAGDDPEIVFRPFVPKVLFQYAIYTPAHRPLSRLANEVSEAWLVHVRAILQRLDGMITP